MASRRRHCLASQSDDTASADAVVFTASNTDMRRCRITGPLLRRVADNGARPKVHAWPEHVKNWGTHPWDGMPTGTQSAGFLSRQIRGRIEMRDHQAPSRPRGHMT